VNLLLYFSFTNLKGLLLQKRAASKKQNTLKLIESSAVLERVQADLIDYNKKPDHGCKYVLHMKDRFSKFTSLYACIDKHAAEVCRHFSHWMGQFGVPKIVQSDNGDEFRWLFEELLQQQGIHIIHGRAKHPQSQGCVEQGNSVVKRTLETRQARLGIQSWVSALPFIVLAMNKQHHSAVPTRMPPYEVIFGQKSRWETQQPYGAPAPSCVEEMIISSSEDTEWDSVESVTGGNESEHGSVTDERNISPSEQSFGQQASIASSTEQLELSSMSSAGRRSWHRPAFNRLVTDTVVNSEASLNFIPKPCIQLFFSNSCYCLH
jgi:hypothetical protein